MDVNYGQDNLEPVIERTGKRKEINGFYKLEFKILNIGTTYYIFENEEIEQQFKEKKLLDEGSEVLLLNSKPQDRENEKDPDSHDRENKKDRKWAIKLKLVDANHCPGSCMFLFWVYEFISDDEINQPVLYIYTGDFLLTDAIKDELKSLRESEKVSAAYIRGDRTRTGKNYGLETEDEAIQEMSGIIDFFGESRSGVPITVKIGADWGMENMWISLAEEYKKCLYVSNQRYKEICSCMDKNNGKWVKQRPEEKNGKTQNEGAETQEEGAETQKEGAETQKEGAETQEEGGKTKNEDAENKKEDGKTQEEGAETQKEDGKTQNEGAETQKEGAETQNEGAETQKEDGKTQNEDVETPKEDGKTQEEGADTQEKDGKTHYDKVE